jgi:hypothetical protein
MTFAPAWYVGAVKHRDSHVKNRVNNFPVILFPHAWIKESDLKRAATLFDPVGIGQPWFLESQSVIFETGSFSFIRLHRPPEALKPRGDSNQLLKEYRVWMMQNRDKGYALSLATFPHLTDSEEAQWQIRQMIRKMGDAVSESDQDEALKWHLFLHLATEIDSNRRDAGELIKQFKKQQSPLQDALGEDSPTGSFFSDLPQRDAAPLIDEHQMSAILEAWLRLFGHTLRDYELLLTFDPYLMNFLTEEIKDRLGQTATHLEVGTVRFTIPDLSSVPMDELLSYRDRFLGEGIGKALATLIAQPGSNASRNEAVSHISEIIEGAFPSETVTETIWVTMRNLPHLPPYRDLARPDILTEFGGKTIILMEDISSNERHEWGKIEG